MGKGGPKAAGLAAKEVLLSSAMVIMAFGGKSVKGAENEKKDLKGDLSVVSCGDEAAGTEGCAVAITARHSRKTQAAEKRERMTILGGRMLATILNGDRSERERVG